jgi:hypothetical protein
MATTTEHEPQDQQASAPTPSALSLSRALLSAAKDRKKTYWYVEILAAALSVAGSFLPWPVIAAVAGVLSVASKTVSKFVLSGSKKLFRLGERARRYDFYERTMGWPVPSADRADMVIAQSSDEIRDAANKLASAEADYYAHKGSPGPDRLLCNLCESMFWTERLMEYMSKVRRKHLALAMVAVLAALVGTILVQPGPKGFVVLKILGSVVALLVAVDVLGEAWSFDRGERETRRLLDAVVAEMRRSALSRDEAIRLMVEYNCLLADLPLLPDSIYEKHKAVLSKAWAEFEKSLPMRCDAAADGTVATTAKSPQP